MLQISKRKRNLLILCMLWVILLGVLAVEPIRVVKIFFPTEDSRSFAHVLFYGFFGFFLCLFLRFKRTLGKLQLRNRYIIGLSFIVTGLLGGITELMQIFTVDRMADWGDLGFDVLGAGIGIVCFYLFRRFL